MVLATVLRNRLGAALIVVQVCLTLAIIANAIAVVNQQVARMTQPSGVDEPNVLTFINRWVGQPADFAARVARDLEVLRAIPGVVGAVSTNGVPLSGRGWGTSIDVERVDPARLGGRPRAALYYLDERGAETLGLELAAGRWFSAGEMDGNASVAILTEDLARRLFPDGDALGREVYFQGTNQANVIGIVRRLVGPDAQVGGAGTPGAVAILPMRMAQPIINNYVVRTREGALPAVMAQVERRLREADPMRAIWEMRPFEETRSEGFRRGRALAVVLLAVSALLLVVTALGIVGLTSYWVTQRRRAIGVHRALGARRSDIVRQIQLESALMSGTGVVLGTVATLLLNRWLEVHLGVPRLPVAGVAAGATGILAMTQLAALWPALRAAAVPPTLAIRSV